MPFLSEAQKRFMFMEHPEIAHRWAREEGRGSQSFRPSLKSESGETWKRGTERVARLPGVRRDFGGLRPNASARFKPARKPFPNLRESDKEEGVTFVPGSRHRELGVPREHVGLRGRDVRAAERR